MIRIENTDIGNFATAIRGMRNPMNSWDRSDTHDTTPYPDSDSKLHIDVGENDLMLMKSLARAGDDHGKFLRMIHVSCDITAPLYWWKEFDTYKIGTVSNSCSTMHKVHEKEFTLDDFSHEHLNMSNLAMLESVISLLNYYRKSFIKEKDKNEWWQMIQMLPSSYNQRRTIDLNYQVLKNMYFARRNHKLDEWHEFCDWIENLPLFSEICIGE